jgi:hypothetical protein
VLTAPRRVGFIEALSLTAGPRAAVALTLAALKGLQSFISLINLAQHEPGGGMDPSPLRARERPDRVEGTSSIGAQLTRLLEYAARMTAAVTGPMDAQDSQGRELDMLSQGPLVGLQLRTGDDDGGREAPRALVLPAPATASVQAPHGPLPPPATGPDRSRQPSIVQPLSGQR